SERSRTRGIRISSARIRPGSASIAPRSKPPSPPPRSSWSDSRARSWRTTWRRRRRSSATSSRSARPTAPRATARKTSAAEAQEVSVTSPALPAHAPAVPVGEQHGGEVHPVGLEPLGEAGADAGGPEPAQHPVVLAQADPLEDEDVLHGDDVPLHAGDLG